MSVDQKEYFSWAVATFGEVATSVKERRRRFLEESLELFQACEGTVEELESILQHVFSRPLGEVSQECGQTILTMKALCECYGINLERSEKDEWARVKSKSKEYWQKRHDAKVGLGLAAAR